MFGFATTRCGKCEKSTFKVQELSLKGEPDYKMISIQCTYCKTPIGITDDNNARLQQQQARILGVERRLSSMEDKLADIEVSCTRFRRHPLKLIQPASRTP